MSEKNKKEELLKKLSHWRDMCGLYAEDHDYDCDNCKEAFFATPCKQAYQQIKEMIQKPGVTEEWIEEKVKEFLKKTYGKPIYPISVKDLTGFIRELVEEIQGK